MGWTTRRPSTLAVLVLRPMSAVWVVVRTRFLRSAMGVHHRVPVRSRADRRQSPRRWGPSPRRRSARVAVGPAQALAPLLQTGPAPLATGPQGGLGAVRDADG